MANAADHEKLREVLEQLQRTKVSRELKFYPLKKVPGPTSLTILQSIAPQATITFQADANRYSVIATTNEHATIAATLEQMETNSGDIQRDLKFYDVGAIGGTDTRTLLASTFTDVTFVATAEGNKLMAWVSPAQDERIRTTLDQLVTERPFQANRTMQLYSITDLGPSASTVLSQAVPTATITVGARADQLAIVANAADHEKLREVLEQLQRTKVSRELKFYPLKKVPGPTSLTILQSIAPQATITFQADANRYSVIATTNDHEAIAATLEQMETNSGDIQRDLKFYDVGAIGGTDTRTLLASTFTDVTFVATAEGNKLMAWVSPAQDERIQATLEQLATEQPFRATRTMELYSIRDLGPSASTVLSQAVPTATITAGARSDQLAIVATAADHEKLTKVLQQLEATKSFPPEKNLVVHPIKGVTPQSVLQVLQPLVDAEVQLTVDATGQQLFVRAFPDKQGDITAVVNQITEQLTGNGTRSTKTYVIGQPNADEAQEALAALFPDAKIVTDADRKILIATATDEQHVTIAQIAAQMKSALLDGDQAVAAVYSLNNASATEVQTLLQTMYNRFDNVRLSVNEKTGRLVVLARPEQHEAIRPLIEQLDSDSESAKDLELAVFRLNQLDGLAIQQALQPLLPRNAQATADRTGRQLLVSASKSDMPALREMVQQMISSQGATEGLETRSYRLRPNEADEAQEALAKLFPDATLVTDVSQEMLVATATLKQHETIAGVVEQMTNAAPDANSPQAIAYSLKAADGANAVQVFQSLFPRTDNVHISFDEKTRSLIAVARPDQHKAIKALIEQLDSSSEAATDLELAVFRLNQLDGLAIQQALQPLLPRNAQATADRSGNQLLVSASKSDMPALREMVQQMISSQGATEGLETRSYRLRPNEADKAQQALAKLFPDATLVTDISREILVATATLQQHEMIAGVVQQMTNAAPDANSPQAIAYSLKAADGANAVQVFQSLFPRTDNVRISFDEKTRSLIAVARPEQHKAIKGLIDQLESGPGDISGRTLEIYPLPTVDGLTAVEVAKGVLQSIDPSATITWEKTSKQLIVSTTANGHQEVSSAVQRFQESDPREMDVIQLRTLSALSAQNAIEGLYGDSFAKSEDYPVIQADEDSQQLLLRGSKKQLQDIRMLLIKMGESGLSSTGEPGGAANRNLRVIPVYGDVEPTLQKIEDLWPRIRRNPIRILRPDGVSEPPVQQRESNRQFSVPAEVLMNDDAADADAETDTDQKSPTTEQNPISQEQNALPPATQTDVVAQPAQSADELAPIIVIPGPGRITIASDDTDALDQLESVLRATSGSPGGSSSNRNRDFSVYQLRNAGSEEVSETLKSVYESRAGMLAFGSVVIVPEPRMNALIVYGGRTDRDRIEQLLEILDTEKLPDSGRIFRTQVIS